MKALWAQPMVVGLLAAVASAQHHDAVYLIGGDGSAGPAFMGGVTEVDLTGPAPVLTTMVLPGRSVRGLKMDYDNRGILFTVMHAAGSTIAGPIVSGLVRYDPRTSTLTRPAWMSR